MRSSVPVGEHCYTQSETSWSLQFAAATVYWEWTRSAEASEKKKQAEKQLTTQLRAEAAAQRQVLSHACH